MSTPDRIVRHLRLRARDEGDVRSTARRLEDALRCASLPDNGGRLLLVRRLDLGCLPADISSQSLALLVERRVGESGYTWVHGGTATASQANAVWFQDTADALITLARQVTQRTPLASAWFWRSVLPNYSAALAPTRILEMIVAHAAAEPAGRVILAQLVAALADIVAPEVLPTLFSPAAQRVLQLTARQLGLSGVVEHGAAAEGSTGWWRRPQGDAVQLSSAVQSIAPWLPLLLAAAGWTEIASVRTPIRPRPDRGNPTVKHETMAIDSPSCAPGLSDNPEQAADSGAFAPSRAHPSNYSPGRLDDAPPEQPLENSAPARRPLENAPQTPPAFYEMHASRAAGLLFLLTVLTRLGFDEWSAALTPAQAQSVACGVLRKALRRLRVDEGDPAHAMLAALPTDSLPFGAVEAPEAWSDPRIGLEMPATADSGTLAALWLTACRRSLRRAARIGVASLVLRPGKFAWSLTHLDVYFDLSNIDLRVRRSALDIDPGWLPWLGRVVGFHYEQGLRT